MQEVEIKEICTKFESFKLKDKYKEKILLSSIMENGIKEPLQCFYDEGKYILLDGYKRYKCSKRLSIYTVPVVCIGSDEIDAILRMIRAANERSMNILEEASFVDELKSAHGLSLTEIARRLEKSVAWVSVRCGMIAEMSPAIRKEVFSGRFPARSYMYNIRNFTRVNKVPVKQVDTFVKAVSGKGLSTRNIETLSYAYFRGSPKIKKQIEDGHIEWTLDQLKEKSSKKYSDSQEFNREQSDIVRDLEILQKYIWKAIRNIGTDTYSKLKDNKKVSLLVDSVLNDIDKLKKELKDCDDR